MTASDNNTAPSDGYEKLSPDDLIRMLRSRDAEINSMTDSLNTVQQQLAHAEQEIKNKEEKLQAKDEQLKAKTIELQNYKTAVSNAYITVSAANNNAAYILQKDFKLSAELVSYNAAQLEEELIRLLSDCVTKLQNGWRYSKINSSSASEKNAGKFPCQRPSDSTPAQGAGQAASPPGGDGVLAEAVIELPDAELPDEYIVGGEDAEGQDSSQEPPPGVQQDSPQAQPQNTEQKKSKGSGASKKPKLIAEENLLKGRELKKFTREHLTSGRDKHESIDAIAKKCTEQVAERRNEAAAREAEGQEPVLPAEQLKKSDLKFLGKLEFDATLEVGEDKFGNRTLKKYCPNCGGVHEFKISAAPKRYDGYLTYNENNKVRRVAAAVFNATCQNCHHIMELNPAEFFPGRLIENTLAEGKGRQLNNNLKEFSQTALDADAERTVNNNDAAIQEHIDETVVKTIEAIVNNPLFQTDSNGSTPGAVNEEHSCGTAADSRGGSRADVKGADDPIGAAMVDTISQIIEKSNNPRERLHHLFQTLIFQTRKIPKDIKEHYKAAVNLPKNAGVDERQTLCEQLEYDAGLCAAKRFVLAKFKEYYQDKLEELSMLNHVNAALRLQNEWSMKLTSAAHKCAPLSMVRKICPEEDILVMEDGSKVINPCTFDAEAYAKMPVFIKCSVTVGLMVQMITMLTELSLPKSRVHRFFTDLGLQIEKQQVINWLIGFSRAFMRPAALKIKSDVLSLSSGVLMDETTLKVAMAAEAIERLAPGLLEKNKGQTPMDGMRLCQIWTVNTSWTSEIQASFCMLSPTRNHTVPVNLLKDCNRNQVRFLTTDGYAGYQTALKVLEKEYGITIKHTPCMTHLRRPLHQFLEDTTLLDIYNMELLPAGCDFYTDFTKNLKRLKKNGLPPAYGNRKLTELDCALLTVYYLINMLYAIDTSVVVHYGYNCQSKEFQKALKTAREQCSALVIDAIYDIIYNMLNDFPELVEVYKREDKIAFRAKDSRREGKFIVSMLKVEPEIRLFIEHPEIELSQSVCERALRTAVLARKSFYVLRSEDGAQAFCDNQTVFGTCRKQKLSLLYYVGWLIANMKMRMRDLENAGKGDASIYMLPHKAELLGSDGKKETLGIYHPENRTMFDKVDMNWLMPYDMAKLIKEYSEKASSL